MRRYQRKREGIRGYVEKWCPKILEKLEGCRQRAGDCVATYAEDGLFEVVCKNKQFVVDLTHKTCGCREWDMIGIPCPHAISAILFNSTNPADYLHDYFSVEMYKRAYAPMIFPILSEE
jgi:hypothetical protein